MGCSKSSSKREVYSNTILPQETRKTLNRKSNFTSKTTRKRRKKNSSRKEINKFRNEKAEVTTDNAEIQRIIRDYYEQTI